MVTTSPVCARRMIIGATPATLTWSLYTTPRVRMAATPASMALPPLSSASNAGERRELVAGADDVVMATG